MEGIARHIHMKTIREVLALALPAVGEQILVMLVFTLDTAMVGHYGGEGAVAAVSLSAETVGTFTNMFVAMGISVAVTSLVARRFGAGERERAEIYATLGYLLGILTALLLSVLVFFFAGDILARIGTAPQVTRLATSYLRIIAFSVFFSMVSSVNSAVLRAYGNTRIPLVASIIVTLLNLGFDYALIFGRFGFPELGIRGAAYATLIAQSTGLLFGLWYMVRHSPIKPRLRHVRRLGTGCLATFGRLSLPASLQEGSISISRLLGNYMIVGLGTTALAANSIAVTIESLSYMPGWGFALAAASLVGLQVGAGNLAKAREYAYTSLFLGTLVMTFSGLLFLAFPESLIRLFIRATEEEAIRLGALCLMIGALEQPTMAISMIASGALRGMGDTKSPFRISFVTAWLLRVPLTLIFIHLLQYPVYVVWIITALYWLADALLLFATLRQSLRRPPRRPI